MIVNDACTVISERCHNLEHHTRVFNHDPRGVVYTHLWCFCTGVTYDEDRNMFIEQSTGLEVLKTG